MKTLFMTRNIIAIFAVMLLIYGLQGISYAQDTPDTLVEFADVNLAKAVRKALRLDTGDGVDLLKIPKAQLVKLTRLFSVWKGITNLAGLEHATQLTWLNLSYNQIRDVTPLANLIHLEMLWLAGNPITDTLPLRDLLDKNPKLIIDIKVVAREAGGPRVEFSDVNLAISVREELELATGDGVDLLKIPKAQLVKLTRLFSVRDGITNLAGLEHATQLTWLNLSYNQIRDVTPLAQLTNLTKLELQNNQLRDIAPLTQLTNLTELELQNNQLRDIAPLTQLTNLTRLSLAGNQIRDVTPLAELAESLTELELQNNQLRDIAPLTQLTNLTRLSLAGNQIRDVTPLAQLTNLTNLYLNGNQIRDVTPLANLIYLETLWVDSNPITDTFPLSTLLDENPNLDIDIAVIREGEGPTLRVSMPQPLAKPSPNRRVRVLTLSSGEFESRSSIEDAVAISSITGTTLRPWGIDRISDTEVKVRFTLNGDIDTNTTLIFTVGPGAIKNYNGPALTAQISIDHVWIDIQGPWLWMVVPTGAADENDVSTEIDSLATASGGRITEAYIAQNGVNEGDAVGQLQWTNGDITTKKICKESCDPFPIFGGCSTLCWSNNINDTLNTLGLGTGGDMKGQTAYALINLVSPRVVKDVHLFIESGDAIKMWLNGEVVHREVATVLGCRSVDASLALDPTVCTPDPSSPEVHAIPVTLKTGDNLLMVKIRQHGKYWGMRVQFIKSLTPTVPTAKMTTDLAPTSTQETPVPDTMLSISPSPVVSPVIGEQLEFSLNIVGGKAVAGYQATVQFDTTALRYVSGANGDFLPAGAFFVAPKVEGNLLKLNAASLAGESDGDGTLATLTFEAITAKPFTLTLSDVLLTNSVGETFVPQVENAEITESQQLSGDVNSDGIVNIADLVLVASNLGKTGQNAADVNGDGVVNIADLVLVAGALGTSAAAPSLFSQSLSRLTAADVKLWLTQARSLPLTDATSQRGIIFLEQLLAALMPTETALLANYPNPFNPETWLPYQLAKDADVTLTIYAIDGQVVRRLALGHQPAGTYQTRSRAAYWDGRNAFGEPVASGVYFYTLTAGDFTATRKMLIRK